MLTQNLLIECHTGALPAVFALHAQNHAQRWSKQFCRPRSIPSGLHVEHCERNKSVRLVSTKFRNSCINEDSEAGLSKHRSFVHAVGIYGCRKGSARLGSSLWPFSKAKTVCLERATHKRTQYAQLSGTSSVRLSYESLLSAGGSFIDVLILSANQN